MTIPFDSPVLFHDLQSWKQDTRLIEVLQECIQMQWDAGKKQFAMFQENPLCDAHVSESALLEILEKGEDISDIRTHQELSNCLVFHTKNLDGSLIDEAVITKRALADQMVAERIRTLFSPDLPLHIEMSGHFWYPKGGFMGWHTNLRKPGWRMYVNYAVDENKSFFRYRNPQTNEIVTAWDAHWNFRLFKIAPEHPFWHCVRSETDRFSLGYKITLAGV